MFSSIHNRFSIATETKFGAIPPTFLSMAEENKEPELSIANDVVTEMEETVENVTEDMVVENITMSLCQAPEPIESKEIEDEVFEKYTPISNNPLFVEPADFVLDDIYANYDDDNFEEQKPAKKKRGALKTFLNEFKPTYRKKLKKSKSGL
jgi:hypothetical protein